MNPPDHVNRKRNPDQNRFNFSQIGERLERVDHPDKSAPIAAQPKSRLRIREQMQNQIENKPKTHERMHPSPNEFAGNGRSRWLHTFFLNEISLKEQTNCVVSSGLGDFRNRDPARRRDAICCFNNIRWLIDLTSLALWRQIGSISLDEEQF